jgi:hypothetical protein
MGWIAGAVDRTRLLDAAVAEEGRAVVEILSLS